MIDIRVPKELKEELNDQGIDYSGEIREHLEKRYVRDKRDRNRNIDSNRFYCRRLML